MNKKNLKSVAKILDAVGEIMNICPCITDEQQAQRDKVNAKISELRTMLKEAQEATQ